MSAGSPERATENLVPETAGFFLAADPSTMAGLMRALPKAAPLALIVLALLSACATTSGRHSTTVALDAILAGPRPAAQRRADQDRHPVQTLLFFGLRPTSRVLQVWPHARGYYTRIIAPLVRRRGRFVAALIDPGQSAFLTARNARYRRLLASSPHLFDHVGVVTFPTDGGDAVPPGSVNLVVGFGVLHQWLLHGEADHALHSIYRALTPGGVFGIVDNRAAPSAPTDPRATTGYVKQSYSIKLIEASGFRLIATSEVNANPRDHRVYPAGAWTLPPTYRLGTHDRARYAAIGEPDRFTLKFVKVPRR